MRCKGTTKSGSRCKRTAPEGEEYCGTHANQANASTAEEARPKADGPTSAADDDIFGSGAGTKPGEKDETSDEWWDTLAEVAMVGTVVVAALVLGRFIKNF